MSNFKLSEFVPYRIAILSASMSGLIAQEYESRFGLSMNQWRIIFILAEHGAISANEIANLTLMDKMTISRALKKLSERKLINRNLSSEDSRKTIITLSETGKSIHAEILPLARNYEEQLQSALTPREKENFSRIIDKLNAQINTLKL